MSIRNRNQKHHDDDEHMDESWLIPYADLLTLLLALFIVLFSMSKINEGKTNALFESLYNAFNSPSVFSTDTGGQKPTNTSFTIDTKHIEQTNKITKTKDLEEQKLQDLMAKLQQYIDKNHLNPQIALTDKKEGIQVTLKDFIVFDSGSDQIKPIMMPILKDIAGLIKTVNNAITVEGYTDNQPIHTSQFPSNWELSGARALSVLRYIQTQGIDPNRLRYVGYGEYHPIYPNDTAAHREANRRVNLVILRK